MEKLPLTALSAAAMGGATAFFCLAMPSALFESLVVASGLPDLLPAAGPPLGATARALFAGGAGLGAGLLTMLILVILGAPSRREVRGERRFTPPHREEAYPESWPRRPLSMETDIGAPVVEPSVPEAEWREIEEEEPAPVPAPEPEPEPEPAPQPPLFRAEPHYDPPAPPMVEEDEEDPISALMERLDAAIARKSEPAEPARPTPRPGPPSTLDDDHLRATLAELQRLASRGRQ